ncbi:MAG: oligosaccharide flippase family protein [Candidatus Kapabacteria bacterium]|nr:oligosaccharide flippase family protein [Candidatus Kapabacteria bacterium]MDW8012601.1 oligosaccharide flippase family protein [Bacteroidota bacterium]
MPRASRQLLRSVASFLIADGLGIIGAVLFSILLGRLRGAEELGLYSFSMAQALLLQLFVEANFAVTLPQEVARTGTIASPLRQAQLAKWYLALIGFPLGVGLTIGLGRADALAPTVAAFVVSLFHSFVSSYAALLQGLGALQLLGAVIAVSSTLGALAGIAAVVAGWPLVPVILVQGGVGALSAWVWFGIALRRWQPGWPLWRTYAVEFLRDVFARGVRGTWEAVLDVLRERWYWIAFGFVTNGYMRFGVLFLGWVGAEAAAIGAYSAAQRFMMVLRMIPNAFFRVLLPQFAKLPDQFSELWAVGMSAAVGVPIAAGIYGAAPWLIEWTFRIPEAVAMLQVLAWALPGVMLSHLAEAYGLTLRGRQRQIVLWAAVVLGLGFLSAASLLPPWGSIAVAYVYVGMETLYALGVMLMVWGQRRKVRHGATVGL